MNAYVITIRGNEQSEAGAAKCIQSSKDVGNEFDIQVDSAVTPGIVDDEMKFHGIEWTYPWDDHQERPELGLRLHPYTTRSKAARMACFMSHYRLWQKCDAYREPILILEDDALWVRKLDPEALMQSVYNIIGINDPRGATRKADVFHRIVSPKDENEAWYFAEAPWVDTNPRVPQGLAGASAYLMKPAGAWHALNLVDRLGAWPNDALLCKQLVPLLGCTRTYYTRVQKTPSTLA